jgi:hypothetical protein
MPKTTWAKIAKGDRVELAGRVWTVEKIKPKGKLVKVSVRSGAKTAASEVPAKGKVKLAPLHEPVAGTSGKAQTRWATREEHAAQGIGPGDPTLTKPPAKPGPDVWETPQGRVERKLDELLSARLVGEATDTDAGYYVPPVDVTTVASHMALFHPNAYDAAKDEATMLAGHEHEHRMAREGKKRLDLNHWHTPTRPKA